MNTAIFNRAKETLDAARRGQCAIRTRGPYLIEVLQSGGTWLRFYGSATEQVADKITNKHNHSHGFTSTILYGKYYNSVLDVAPAVEGEFCYYDLVKEGNLYMWKLRREGLGENPEKWTIVRTVTTELEAGDTYEMHPHQMHYARRVSPLITYMDMWDHAPTQYSMMLKGFMEQPTAQPIPSNVPDEVLPETWKQIDAFCALAGL